jgi:hypothetical protein
MEFHRIALGLLLTCYRNIAELLQTSYGFLFEFIKIFVYMYRLFRQRKKLAGARAPDTFAENQTRRSCPVLKV